MRFLVDAQLPPSLVPALRQAGCDARHVQDAGLRDASDREIWTFAVAESFALITKDEDFAIRVMIQKEKTSVVWVRFGNCSNELLFSRLVPLMTEIERRIEMGEQLIEIQ